MRPRLSLAAILVLVALWLIEWLAWQNPGLAQRTVTLYSLIGAKAILLAALSILAVLRGRRWSAPLVTIAVGATAAVVVDLVGIITGQFLQRGLGPAVVFASLFVQLLFVLAMALLGTAIGRLYLRRRVPSSAEAI